MDDLEHTRALLAEACTRIHDQVGSITDGIDGKILSFRIDVDANTVAWLIWHLTRAEDAQVASLADQDQAWHADGWADRFALSLDADDTGYGATTAQVGALDDVTIDLLTGYYESTHTRTRAYVDGLTGGELDRVIDDSYDPPVTVGARLVSIIEDCLAHAGQAAYVRGVAERTLGQQR